MLPSICRWGILGTANIARKNWKAILRSGNGKLVAVGSRDRKRALEFISACQKQSPFEISPTPNTYDELLARDDIDAVYIPLPTGIRRDWVLKAAKAKKHVLCEKPCGADAEQLRQMIDACSTNGVQFMDGVMFMHSARLPLMRNALDDGQSVGEIRRIATQFTFAAPSEFVKSNIRASADLEPLGCLGDLGWYNIRFALWAMKYAMPTEVTGRLISEHGTVPMEFSGDLMFAGSVSASFFCSFKTELQQWAHVSGTKGSLYLNDFVLPYYGCEAAFETNTPAFNVDGCSYHMEDHAVRNAAREYSDGKVSSQEANMIRAFSSQVLSGKTEPMWGEIALKTQLVLDACMKSARVGGAKITP